MAADGAESQRGDRPAARAAHVRHSGPGTVAEASHLRAVSRLGDLSRVAVELRRAPGSPGPGG